MTRTSPSPGIVGDGRAQLTAPPAADLSRPHIAMLLAANFGASMAAIVPVAYSLALRVDQLAPGSETSVGYILGIGAVLSLLTGAPLGTLSDRTRSRLGRRTPYVAVGALFGTAALAAMAYAPNLPLLGAGWALATVGWGTALGTLGSIQADRVAGHRRGTVSGLMGFTSLLAPVAGVLLIGGVGDRPLLVFVLPGAVGLALVTVFLAVVREDDARLLPSTERLTARMLARAYVFNPRRHRVFAWNWLGRFVFFCGQSMYTAYTTFFFAQRLDLSVREVAGLIAVTGTVSVVTMTAGTVGGGFLSDRLGRGPFVAAAAVLFAVGATVSAFAYGLPGLVTGSALMNLGIALFAAVNQATVLDVLPERSTEAGRFMAISALSQKLPSALAPLPAAALITLGAGADGPNYTLLYLLSGSLGLLGGLIVLARVTGIRPSASPSRKASS